MTSSTVQISTCLKSLEGNFDIETLSINRVLDKEHFYGKIM